MTRRAFGIVFLLLALAGAADLVRGLVVGGASAAESPAAPRQPAESPPDAPAQPAPLGAVTAAPVAAPAPEAPAGPVAPFCAARATAPRVVERNELAARLGELLSRKVPAGVATGVCVRSVTTGETLFESNAAAPLVIASNTKLVTTAAALVMLGADFAFETHVLAAGPLRNGVLEGDLVVRGDGDPDPIDRPAGERLLHRVVAAVAGAGITTVTGRLVVDDTCFDRRYVAPGWDPRQLHLAYCAPVAGLSLHENCIRLDVSPGAAPGVPAAVQVTPAVPPYAPRNDLVTGPAGSRNEVHVPAPVQVGAVRVTGSTPHGSHPVPLYSPVLEPARAAAEVLAAALAQAGVEIRGGVALSGAPAQGDTHTLIARLPTPLRAVLPRMNKDSINVLAEHVYKRAGRAVAGVGTFESGAAAVRAALDRLGIDAATSSSADGSGLSRGNRYPARVLCALLDALYRRPEYREVLVASLAVGGVDGTLDDRFEADAYRGRVIGKSGYISRVSTLSGLAQADSGEVLAFSILMNDLRTSAAEMKRVQDEMAMLLVDLAPAGGEG